MKKSELKSLVKECIKESQMSDIAAAIDEFINNLSEEKGVSPEQIKQLVKSYLN